MSITKTRWTIESDRIIIRPYGSLFILGGVIAVIFAAFFIGYNGMGQQNPLGSAPFALFILALALFCFMSGFTYVCFDRNKGKMQLMLFGFLPIKTISFDKLYKVNVVTQNTGSFNYRVFTKANKYGRGIVISSGYGKDTNRNAVAFASEVIPLIHQYIGAADNPIATEQPIAILDYNFFTETGGVYQIKNSTTGALILGLGCLFIGIHEATPFAWLTNTSTIGKLLAIGFPSLIGIIFIAAAYTKFTFDTNTRIVERKSPLGIGNHRYSFDEFVNFQTIRKTYNGVYTGTDVEMYFQKAASNKLRSVQVSSFRNTKKIERLISEIESIMKVR